MSISIKGGVRFPAGKLHLAIKYIDDALVAATYSAYFKPMLRQYATAKQKQSNVEQIIYNYRKVHILKLRINIDSGFRAWASPDGMIYTSLYGPNIIIKSVINQKNKPDWFEEYCYWDLPGKPEGTTQKKWAERKQNWQTSGALGDDVLSLFESFVFHDSVSFASFSECYLLAKRIKKIVK